MSFPYIFASNFQAGTNAEWDSESDTGAKLDFPHYSDLARIPGMSAPYRGAYCMRVDLRPADTNAHTLTEGDIDIADGAQRFFRWYMWASADFTASADDVFSIFELQQAGGATTEMTVGMRVTAATNALDIGVGDGTAPSSYVGFPRNRWVCIELAATVSTGGTGAMTLYLDGVSVIALTTLTQAAAVGTGAFGTKLTLATTSGTLLYADFVMDDLQLYPNRERWPAVERVTKTTHVFPGPGYIEGATLLSSTGTMSLYDTDNANANDLQSAVVELNASGPFVSIDTPTYFERGCYVVLAGTNPYGEIRLLRWSKYPGQFGPRARGSDGVIRLYGSKRTSQPQIT